MKFSMFIQPPSPKPRSTTGSPPGDDPGAFDAEDLASSSVTSASVTAVHETGGSVIRSVPSSRRASRVRREADPLRIVQRVRRVDVVIVEGLRVADRHGSEEADVDRRARPPRSRLRLTRKTAVSPLSASWVATASTTGTSPYDAVS